MYAQHLVVVVVLHVKLIVSYFQSRNLHRTPDVYMHDLESNVNAFSLSVSQLSITICIEVETIIGGYHVYKDTSRCTQASVYLVS